MRQGEKDRGIMIKRPPLGVMPLYIWNKKRVLEIAEAITRYAEAFQQIPQEWIDEYNNLVIDKKFVEDMKDDK